jgi:hypothetical protein
MSFEDDPSALREAGTTTLVQKKVVVLPVVVEL